MAVVALTPPPVELEGKTYTAYKQWLLENFFDRICAYCLLRHESLHVEHHEPQSYARLRTNDPTNLLIACADCNGPGGKGDYHPDHASRKRLPGDKSGHTVLDVRSDDFAHLLQIDTDGTIRARPGPGQARAAWNVILLKLDRSYATKQRGAVLESVAACESTVRRMRSDLKAGDEELLTLVCRELAQQLPMLDVFGIELSEELRARVESLRDQLRAGP